MLGLPIDTIDLAGAQLRIRLSVADRRPCFFSTPNLNFLVASRHDSTFRDSVLRSDLSVADGMPLIWIARLLDIPLRARVAGSSLVEALCRNTGTPLSVFFFGAPPGVAEQASLRLNAVPQGLRCVGFECPGFGSVEEMSSAASIARINASGADLVVVALGARKGQAWIEHNRHRITAPAISHLGAVVGFIAGTINRAPVWMQRTGLEWLWRISEEPALWNRYFQDGMSLARLMATRVLPHAMYLRRHRPAAAAKLDAAMDVTHHEGGVTLRLRGTWGNEQVDPLRREFAAAAVSDGEVMLDLAGVSYIDSAFVGLMLLLYGSQSQSGMRLVIVAASQPVHRVLRYCCAEFLLGSTSMPSRPISGLDHQRT